MNSDPSDFLLLLARNSAAAGVLVLIVLVVQRLCHRQLSPHWRCALWLVVAARLLPFSFSSPVSLFNLLPAAPARDVDSNPVAELWLRPLAASSASAKTHDATTLPVVNGTASAGPAEMAPLTVPAQYVPLSWPTTLLLVWLTGVGALSIHVVITTLALRRQVGRATAIRDGDVLLLLRSCSSEMGARRVPGLAESTTVSTPALFGFLRPRLLLPAGFIETLTRAELRFVFLHELAHLRRHDLPLNWLMTVLQILHWFNPLVWYGFARWRADREIACDAAAIEASGPQTNVAYGHTILRLLENLSPPRARPGLVGILENPRQLRRRLSMITNFTPARRPHSAVTLLVLLALVGLTDAQVPPLPATTAAPPQPTAQLGTPEAMPLPSPTQPYVLFLLNAAETMLETPQPLQARADVTSDQSSGQGATLSKWQHAIHALEQRLHTLPAKTGFHVAIYSNQTLESMGGPTAANDQDAIARTLSRLRQIIPRGTSDLEAAFASANDPARFPPPERLVLITDGLPNPGVNASSDESTPEADRIRKFESAVRHLRPRVPVHTLLVPGSGDDASAAGLYWQLAIATRGSFTALAPPGSEPPTHLAFVVDTSGSMRDPNTGRLWPSVIDTIDATLTAHPELAAVQLVDADGRFILPRRGTGSAGWHAATADTRETILRTLRTYEVDTVSNPVPGLRNAIRFLSDANAPSMRMSVVILGDEFNSSDSATDALQRIIDSNPPDATGRRPVTINAIGFPTTVRAGRPMGNTGLRYANLMRLLVQENGGSFVGLPEL